MPLRFLRRLETPRELIQSMSFRPAAALREALAAGYTLQDLRADVLAGIVVGIVALPLSMALAIASGVPPQHGIATAIVAGLVSGLLGGSRVQVSGPTAAFVVLLQPISAQHGIGGLFVATTMAGVMLVVLGAARMGRLISYIPYPVTTGFTAGIAVVIATLQLKDFLGLSIAAWPESYIERVEAIVHALPTIDPSDAVVGAATLATLLVWPHITTRVPAPLIGLAVGALVGAVLPGTGVDTLGTRFSYTLDGVTRPGIPPIPPSFEPPWHFPGPDGRPLTLSWELLRELFPSAFAIALLGAIESLLSAVVADGMAGTRHDSDTELIGQGMSNILAPFFGGFASTGAIARTATNVRAGGRSPIAAAAHSIFVLVAILVLAPLLQWLPMASLAALLLIVAWNMSDVKHFAHMLRIAPKSDVTVLLACFSLTVLFDMVIAVTGGVILAALLFMRRMAEIAGATLAEGEHPELPEPLPRRTALYQIAGPLFFGAAQKATASFDAIGAGTHVLILDMGAVPAMDATGLVALDSAIERLIKRKTLVILSRVQPQPMKAMMKAGLGPVEGELQFAETLTDAIHLARDWVTRTITGVHRGVPVPRP